MAAYDDVLNQVDRFIKKYYRNEMLKGSIWVLGTLLLSLLLVSGLEYIGRFNGYVRAFLFFSFLAINLVLLIQFIVRPLLKFLSFGKRISNYQASVIIGKFFPQISDRLLNTIQLKEDGTEANLEIISASIRQKSKELSVFDFTKAVQLKENLRYVKLFSPVFILFLVVAIGLPEWLADGTKRVVQYDQEFIPESPFQFELLNKDLLLEEGSAVEIQVNLKGSSFPDKVFLLSQRGKFLMEKKAKNVAVFTLDNVVRNTEVSFLGNDFESQKYTLNVLPKSSVSMAEAVLDYPKYLNRKKEVLKNVGDLKVPEGTYIDAKFILLNVKELKYNGLGGKTEVFSNNFKKGFTAKESGNIELVFDKGLGIDKDTTSITIGVVKDRYPSISVQVLKDSLKNGLYYFNGNVSDDYGVSRLLFNYDIISADGNTRSESILVKGVNGLDRPFVFSVDFGREDLKLNDLVDFSFSVYDNDGVNGSKKTTSQKFQYKLPGLSELNDKRSEDQREIEKNMKRLLEKSKTFKNDLDKLKKESLNNDQQSWKTKNDLNNIMKAQESISKDLENLKKQIDQSTEDKNKLSEVDKELLKKQEEIERLLEELMDDEMKELLEKLSELLEKQNMNDFQRELNDAQNKSEEQNRQLDRSLEMLKKLEVNEKIDDLEKALEELSKKQEEVKDLSEEKGLSKEEKERLQDEINEEFDELMKDKKEIDSLNSELDRHMELGDQNDLEKEIQEAQEEAKESLSKGKKSKAGESQSKSSEGMSKMAEELNKAQEEANTQQDGEDLESLKRILKNLMLLSFDQEKNMKDFASVLDGDPAYHAYGRKQRRIIDDTKSVADSMLALANRQPKIASFIDEELMSIDQNHGLALEGIDEHKRRDIGTHQQFVMTSYNNLALLLNEALESLQEQMKNNNSKPGEGSCNKPGGKGRPKPGAGMGTKDMKQMLKDQLKSLQDGEGKGNKPGKKGEGQGGQNGQGEGQGLGAKQLSKMAAEQGAIRQKLMEMRNELNKDGKGTGNQLNPLINELDKQQDDLINRRINREMINRQKEILTRLLESEKALMERGFEEKRESTSGKNLENGNLIRFEEYNKEKLRQIEMLKSVDPGLKKYYKDKTNDYYNLSL